MPVCGPFIEAHAVEDGHLEVGVQLLQAREELIEDRVSFVPARRAMR